MPRVAARCCWRVAGRRPGFGCRSRRCRGGWDRSRTGCSAAQASWCVGRPLPVDRARQGRHRVEVGAGEALTVGTRSCFRSARPRRRGPARTGRSSCRGSSRGVRSASRSSRSWPPIRAALSSHPRCSATSLVPSSAGRLLKAATFLSSKWPHLSDPAHVRAVVRGPGGSSAVADTSTTRSWSSACMTSPARPGWRPVRRRVHVPLAKRAHPARGWAPRTD